MDYGQFERDVMADFLLYTQKQDIKSKRDTGITRIKDNEWYSMLAFEHALKALEVDQRESSKKLFRDLMSIVPE